MRRLTKERAQTGAELLILSMRGMGRLRSGNDAMRLSRPTLQKSVGRRQKVDVREGQREAIEKGVNESVSLRNTVDKPRPSW